MAKKTHIITILKQLLDGEAMSSSDSIASNSNQYFGTIKDHGIALVEVWVKNTTNAGRHKERSLYQSPDNIERAKAYMSQLKGKKKPEVHVNDVGRR